VAREAPRQSASYKRQSALKEPEGLLQGSDGSNGSQFEPDESIGHCHTVLPNIYFTILKHTGCYMYHLINNEHFVPSTSCDS